MKFNIANPSTAQQKLLDIDDEKLAAYDLRWAPKLTGEQTSSKDSSSESVEEMTSKVSQ